MTQKSKQTEIGMIPDDWEIKKVGDFVDIKHGYAFKGEFFVDTPNENIVLTPGNFNIGGGFKANKFKYTTEKFSDEYVLNKDDILVTMTDLSKAGDTLGYAAKIPDDPTKNFLHNQRLGLLKFKSNVSQDFLYWVLRAKKYNFFVVGTSSGSTVKHTSPNRIKDYSFGIPSNYDEQTQIAKILTDLDLKIELDHQMNNTLEKIAKTVFKQWFVDFEFPDKNGRPYMSSGGEMVYSKDLGRKIPKGWSVGQINDLCYSITNGGTPKRMESTYWNGDVAWFKTGELTDGPLIESGEYITETGLQNSACKLWDVNTILVALYASPTVGRLGLMKIKGTSNQACSALIAKKEIGYPFLFYVLFFKRIEFNSFAVGAAQQNINQDVVKKTKTIIPSLKILTKFNALIESIFDRQTTLSIEYRSLSQIRDSLLPKLMSGKIRVPVEVKK